MIANTLNEMAIPAHTKKPGLINIFMKGRISVTLCCAGELRAMITLKKGRKKNKFVHLCWSTPKPKELTRSDDAKPTTNPT